MDSSGIECFESPADYIVALFGHWKNQNPENSVKKLSRLIGTDFEYTCIWRVVTGASKNISFELFDSIFRVIYPNRSHYFKSIQKWFPKMVEVADRIVSSGMKPDQCFFLRDALDREIYQQLISGRELSREDISRRWGIEGIASLNRLMESNHFFINTAGKVEVASNDGYIRLGGHLTMNLVRHNVSQVTPENSGTGENLYSYRVLYLSDSKRELLRDEAIKFRSAIDRNFDEKKDAIEGESVVSIQVVMRTHDLSHKE